MDIKSDEVTQFRPMVPDAGAELTPWAEPLLSEISLLCVPSATPLSPLLPFGEMFVL